MLLLQAVVDILSGGMRLGLTQTGKNRSSLAKLLSCLFHRVLLNKNNSYLHFYYSILFSNVKHFFCVGLTFFIASRTTEKK